MSTDESGESTLSKRSFKRNKENVVLCLNESSTLSKSSFVVMDLVFVHAFGILESWAFLHCYKIWAKNSEDPFLLGIFSVI